MIDHGVTVTAAPESPVLVYDRIRMDLIPLLRETLLDPSLLAAPSYPSLSRGAWKSSEGIFDYAPSTRALRETIEEYTVSHRQPLAPGGARTGRRGMRPIGWAMVGRNGSAHPRHQHQGSIQSGIYYVTAGDPAVPTIFEIGHGDELEIDPVPGRLVLFPGNLFHRVDRYDGTEPRITIAFDVRR